MPGRNCKGEGKEVGVERREVSEASGGQTPTRRVNPVILNSMQLPSVVRCITHQKHTPSMDRMVKEIRGAGAEM